MPAFPCNYALSAGRETSAREYSAAHFLLLVLLPGSNGWLYLWDGPIVSAGDPRADLQVVAFRIASCLGGVRAPAFARAVFDWSQIGAADKMTGFSCHEHWSIGADAHIPIIYT